MVYPSIDELVKKFDSKYTLVALAAKRARELMNGEQPLTESKSNKAVTIALEEMDTGKLTYERTKSGIK